MGIAGPSGCGKSSLIKAICKLEKCEGDVLIDGANITSLSRKEMSQIIALVPQSPFLIAGTIYENICYGLDREPSQEEVDEAVIKANLHDFINSLPDKMNTLISEGGSNLSGGQKQRIAVARIFLRKPSVLILDEATSSVDTRLEALIQKAMDRVMEGRTSFVIAHRLSTIREADLILVMKQGEIIEKGTHHELLEQGGFYEKLYNSQFAEEGDYEE